MNILQRLMRKEPTQVKSIEEKRVERAIAENMQIKESEKVMNPYTMNLLIRNYEVQGKCDLAQFVAEQRDVWFKRSRDARRMMEDIRWNLEDTTRLSFPSEMSRLEEIDKTIRENVNARDRELYPIADIGQDIEITSGKRYGYLITPETLSAMRAPIIARYDPIILESCQEKDEIRKRFTKFDSLKEKAKKDIRSLSRNEFESIYRAYRISSREHPLRYDKESYKGELY